MTESQSWKGPRAGRALGTAAVILVLAFGVARAEAQAETTAGTHSVAEAQAVAEAQTAEAQTADETEVARRTQTRARGLVGELVGLAAEFMHVTPQSARGAAAEGTQLPQDIRIMQRIVSTALGEVEAPELPNALEQEPESAATARSYAYSSSGREAAVWLATSSSGSRVFGISNRDVTGFYMQGYGYLFTVERQVAPRGRYEVAVADFRRRASELNALVGEARRAAAAGRAEEARAAGEAERALEQERQRNEERQAAWDEWSAQYRDRLAEALREVVAVYGSTLNRAQPDESITFIADFGGGESETVTVSAQRGQLTGASREQNLAAVRMAKGETGVSSTLRTELKIMAEIIDSSLQVEGPGEVRVYADQVRYFGGGSAYQYVPGYGVLFRKTARLNLATQLIQRVSPSRLEPGVAVESLRRQAAESSEEQRQAYSAHLADLKQKTAEILATYGPTLTEMEDDDWVGVYYNVGSAAGLLEGGISNFLVQAQMVDIRQAGRQTDGAAWLLDHLVTNEREDSEPAPR